MNIYLEKQIFEDLILNAKEYPVWNSIFMNHSQIFLNLTDEELMAEEIQGSIIFEFIKANGGRITYALKEFFDSIYEDNRVIANKPRSAFFLNYSKIEAEAIQSAFGVIVNGYEGIDDNILKRAFFKELNKGAVFENETSKGWQNLVNFPLPPSNAMVITDEYLFANEESGFVVGVPNVIELVNAFLPQNLNIPYHLTIISNDHPEHSKPPKTKEWCEKIVNELKIGISALRSYPILLEIVFTKTIHKRKLILNYVNATCDKGFAVFNLSDGKTVRNDNDFRCDRVFTRTEPTEGDTDYKSAEIVLFQLKKKFQSVQEFIKNSKVKEIVNNRILGDYQTDKSIINRLLNDV